MKIVYFSIEYREYYLERADNELMKSLEEKIYILVYDDSCFVHKPTMVELSIIEQYGKEIGGQIFIIHQHSQGRDLSRFFDHFLEKISKNRKNFNAKKRELKFPDYFHMENKYLSIKLMTRIKHFSRKLSLKSDP